MHFLVLCKRQYTNKDVIDDRYGRLWEIPLALAKAGHTVTAVCLSYQPRTNNEATVAVPGGGSVTWKSVNFGAAGAGFFRYLTLLNRTIREHKPDVIWSASDTLYAVLGESLARKHQCRVIIDLYDNFEYFASYRLPVLRSRFRRAVRESDGVSCVSEALRRHVVREYGRHKETAVITNAVDTSLFTAMDKSRCRTQLGLPVNGNLVGAVGDISNYRGADTLYQAFSEHAEDLAGTTLVVAGHRDGQTKIPTSDNVIDLGCLPPADVPVLLNCLDVAIIYNRSSTFGDFCFPQKFYEAVACDLPVVVANVGELGYLLRAQTELFYEDEDVTSLVTAINRQLTNKLRAGVAVPSWAEQAALLLQLSQSVQGEG